MQLLSNDVKTFSYSACLILSVISAASLFAEQTATTGNAESLAAAEKTFAQEARDKGTRSAFLHVLSEDAIVFEPGPTNAKKWWGAKPESKSALQWEPVLAAASTNGDLGYTTGPWSHQPDGTGPEGTAFGQFVSIWRWKNGQWKLQFDLGSKNPAPKEPAGELQLVDNHAPNESAADAEPVMRAHDRRYAANRAGQIGEIAEENVRLFQPQQFPVIGREKAAAALQKETKSGKFGEPKGGEVSAGGDLGYVWGEYRDGAATEASGYYLRIWRKDRSGDWKLALDLLHPR